MKKRDFFVDWFMNHGRMFPWREPDLKPFHVPGPVDEAAGFGKSDAFTRFSHGGKKKRLKASLLRERLDKLSYLCNNVP